ncbi:MAG: hypothetical protein IIB25_04635, partial [Chloroflexi bacterium]|nr:hypothetical protein [Chloroflexota bacterium]
MNFFAEMNIKAKPPESSLDQFAYLSRFCIEEALVEPPRPEPYADWFLAETAFHQRTGDDDTFRRLLDHDLKFGYESNALNRDRRARLKSNNKSSYFGALGELRAGRRLTSGGAVIDEWDPLGRGKRRGEFLLKYGSIKIFTEVKSHFGDSSMQLASRRAASLRQRLYERRKSLNSVDVVVDVSNSPRGTDQYLEGDLLSAIARYARNVTRRGASEIHDLGFVDCSVRIEVREKKFDTGMTRVMNGGTAGPVESMMRTLKKAARP